MIRGEVSIEMDSCSEWAAFYIAWKRVSLNGSYWLAQRRSRGVRNALICSAGFLIVLPRFFCVSAVSIQLVAELILTSPPLFYFYEIFLAHHFDHDCSCFVSDWLFSRSCSPSRVSSAVWIWLVNSICRSALKRTACWVRRLLALPNLSELCKHFSGGYSFTRGLAVFLTKCTFSTLSLY